MELTNVEKELYAVEIYRLSFDLMKYERIKFESPDFIVWKKHFEKIGVEVTTASSNKQNELIKIANSKNRNTLGKLFDYEKHKDKGRIFKQGVQIEFSASTDIHNIILSNIKKKFEKLNKNFTVLDKNVLCCIPISSALYSQKDYRHFAKKLNEIKSNFTILFDEITIIQPDRVVKFDLNESLNYDLGDSKLITSELSRKKQLEVKGLI